MIKKMRNDVIILGRPIQLQERKKAQMKSVAVGDSPLHTSSSMANTTVCPYFSPNLKER